MNMLFKSILIGFIFGMPLAGFAQVEVNHQAPPPPASSSQIEQQNGSGQQGRGEQMGRTPDEKAHRQTEWMRKNLGINEDQAHRVYDIMLHSAQEAENLQNMPKGPEKRNDRRELAERRDNKLREVLTPDQFSGFKQHEEEMKQRMRNR